MALWSTPVLQVQISNLDVLRYYLWKQVHSQTAALDW